MIKKLLLFVFIVAISGFSYAQESIELNTNLRIANVPVKIIPYAAGKFFTLSDLTIEKTADSFIASAKIEKLITDYKDVTFNVYVVTADRLLLAYYSAKDRAILIRPGGSAGDFVFTMEGYKLDKDNGKDVIKFDFPLVKEGIYNILGNPAKVYVFCIGGDKQVDEGSFTALSNVVAADVD
jgi:hypothetical protein